MSKNKIEFNLNAVLTLGFFLVVICVVVYICLASISTKKHLKHCGGPFNLEFTIKGDLTRHSKSFYSIDKKPGEVLSREIISLESKTDALTLCVEVHRKVLELNEAKENVRKKENELKNLFGDSRSKHLTKE